MIQLQGVQKWVKWAPSNLPCSSPKFWQRIFMLQSAHFRFQYGTGIYQSNHIVSTTVAGQPKVGKSGPKSHEFWARCTTYISTLVYMFHKSIHFLPFIMIWVALGLLDFSR